MRNRTCFDCRWASIDEGYPGDRYTPPEPSYAICTDPLGEKMQNEYDNIMLKINRATRNLVEIAESDGELQIFANSPRSWRLGLKI